MARTSSRSALPTPRIRRAYYDCRYGQLHVHQAMPSGGGFDEATTLLCIPGGRGSGRYFEALLAPLGRDRSIYAIDLPGQGESDAPEGGPGVEAGAAALADLLDTMHIRRADLLAQGSGAAIALALARQRASAMHRMVLAGAEASMLSQARSLASAVLSLELAAADAPVMTAADALRCEPLLREFLGSAQGA